MATAAAIGLAGTGIGLSAAGTYSAGKAQKAYGKYQQLLSRRAADVELALAGRESSELKKEAELIRKKTSYDVSTFRKEAAARIGTAISKVATAGVKLEGTPAYVISDIKGELEMDARMLRWGGMTQAFKYDVAADKRLWAGKVKAQQLREQGDIAAWQGRLGMQAARTQTMGTLLSGAGSLGLYGLQQGWFNRPSLSMARANRLATSWLNAPIG